MQQMIWNGIKGGLYALIAVIIGMLAESLSLALGFKPEGVLNQAVWMYAILPLITAIVRFLKEYGANKIAK